MAPEPVRAYWWNEEANFGDALTPLLIHRLFGRAVTWAPLESADLVASGSLLQWLTPVVHLRTSPLEVWGSGFIFDEEPAPPADSVRLHALRGARSSAMFGPDCRPPLGDVGLLAARVVEVPRTTHHRIGIVPHLWHLGLPQVLAAAARHGARLIDVREPPEKVIAAIADCDVVFSSSLHGLAVADSLRIPNWWITTEPEPFGGSFKFLDYYSAFGLIPRALPVDTDLEAVIAGGAGSYARPGLEQLCEDLVAAFPDQFRK